MKNIKMPDLHLSDLKLNKHFKAIRRRDAGVAAAFVGAIAVLLLVACYVVSRLAGDRAHRAKWQDYNDCGWA